ncbi:hypothetical protein [Actinoallomurus sp. NPDC050550]|uniref:hypothetical protein n=1 Tax=Actinoallomurus sp. NPDC050550 TaxID=3154937 RepID=UPI0033CE7077
MARLRPHAAFIAVLSTAVVLRVVAMAAYRPALWFNDSFDYLRIGLAPHPDAIRPAGYGLLLWALRPFHSFALLVALQHLMGLATAVMIYALARRRRARPSVAVLATAPVLFDAYQLELEHLVMSDTLFMLLLTAAITVVLWNPAISRRAGAATGLLLALATLTRTVSMPLIVVLVVFLLIRRAPWRTVGAFVLAAALPVVAYGLWFSSANGRYAVTETDGVFLWGRTAAFADCAKIKPPRDLAAMCPHGRPGERAASSTQIWQYGSPTGWSSRHTFTAETNDRARRFALRAIAAQPLDYATVVADGLRLTFGWERRPYPTDYTAALYRFPDDATRMPAAPDLGGTEPPVVRAYAGGGATGGIAEPWAGWLRAYQDHVFLRGTVLAAILAVGFAGVLRRGLDGALTWTVACFLLLVPVLTTDFDYRYVLPAVPFACAAAALATVPQMRVGRRTSSPAQLGHLWASCRVQRPQKEHS